MRDLSQEIPRISPVDFLKGSDQRVCRRLAEGFADAGVILFKVSANDDALGDEAMGLMLEYFRQPDALKARDEYPENHQVGWTPSGGERARSWDEVIKRLASEYRPIVLRDGDGRPLPDAKERFFAPIGPRPTTTNFPSLNLAPVIPAAFSDRWERITTGWGSAMMQVMFRIAEMHAVGLGLERNAIRGLLENGPHLYAPTGTDLSKFGQIEMRWFRFHNDLNAYTIHTRSNYPGLRIWLRDGRSMFMSVPPGYVLVQIGQQIEHLTGGAMLAGFHEGLATAMIQPLIARDVACGVVPWRCGATFFGHVASDQMLVPFPSFKNDDNYRKYPPILAGDQVKREIDAIGLTSR